MSGSVASATAASGAASSNTRLAGDFNTFLTLLTTQLQNQSPTDPLDANQMTNQLVQFASVEQQIAMNQNLESLITLQQTAQLTAAAPLMGQRAEVESNQVALQNGRAEIRLPAAGTARTAEVAIIDAGGRVLRQQAVTLGTAATGWNWDGRDASGRSLADGAYGVRVTGRGANGEAVPLSFTVAGTVTGAERSGSNLTLSMGGMSVGFDRLRRLTPND
ncbi:flagellar hook assembly protein FlgD [Neoroseomonas soli]|uniref:Basal-body rod modification protein FlgD n=1 Tax=Neoroseomonas soli TaxID=1081025 RepID=A0A9X9X0P2_9PROT|nr:flagellar hook capping FlgD N-terminal domain-containing protein [Neoroseomonas soli]MBR0672971.1 flagellar hook assembly protein FlgD [Neoroseomonas soli]